MYAGLADWRDEWEDSRRHILYETSVHTHIRVAHNWSRTDEGGRRRNSPNDTNADAQTHYTGLRKRMGVNRSHGKDLLYDTFVVFRKELATISTLTPQI